MEGEPRMFFLLLLVHLLQWLMAFFALDLFFRTMPMEPHGLPARLRSYQGRYALLTGLFTLVGAGVQLWLAGGWGLALGTLGWVPWWMLWRFGWRKQFTFLYKDDGGRHLAGTTKPDPH